MDEIVFTLEPGPARPVFLQLSEAVIAAIVAGRLRPGQRLPGTRALARSLGLNRNTVDAAYQEALLQGWLEARASSGTFVARDLPSGPARPDQSASGPKAAPKIAPRAPEPRLSFSDGAPDVRLLPVAEIARALRHVLRGPDLRAAGAYGDPRGAQALRDQLALHLSGQRGLTIGADDVLATRGSQMALFLAARALVAPGGAIAMEEPGYPLAACAFRAAGLRVVAVPVDAGGLSIAALEQALGADPSIRAVHVTPHHQYPTTVTLGAGRRVALLELARRTDLAIIEDDYDHDYRFDGRPVLPLAARAAEGARLVYVGSLSKLLAPGLRLGYAVAPADVLGQMADLRQAIERQGDLPLELAVATLMRDGDLWRHLRKSRRIYEARRDALCALLEDRLGDRLAFTPPVGGLALWATLAAGLDAARWSAAAGALGLCVTPARAFCLDEAHAPQAFRLGFAGLDGDEMAQAVEWLARSCP